MLKSTYTPSANLANTVLPPGWSEHTAPTGHKYYYHAETKESTYTRPGAVPTHPDPSASFRQHQAVPSIDLSDPKVANAYISQHGSGRPYLFQGSWAESPRDNKDGSEHRRVPRQRVEPTDRPQSQEVILGCEPWILVFTKYGRRFVYNPDKHASYWRIPDKLKPSILELDQKRILKKASENESRGKQNEAAGPHADTAANTRVTGHVGEHAHSDTGSDFEEIEVTDDEDVAEDSSGHPQKRLRVDDPPDGGKAVEFSEADIAYQLQSMDEEYGLEQGDYDDGDMENWPEGAEGLLLSVEDASELFKDLLDDFHINPYSPWEKLIEEGKVIDDPRYSVLSTSKARREVWEQWSVEKIKLLKEQRLKEEKKDPRIAYMAFLQERATPKLYWTEFKRRYRKEAVLKESALSDRERERWYRDYVNRLKMPQSILKADLVALLKSTPLSMLNNKTILAHLPSQVLVDIRFASLDPAVRDPLIVGFLSTLGPPPDENQLAREIEDACLKQTREGRRRREQALAERERAVALRKLRLEKRLGHERANMRDEGRELTQALQISKRGLQSQLTGGIPVDRASGNVSVP